VRRNITCNNVADLYGFDVEELTQTALRAEVSSA
jgi:hypothetical protein